ncbi:MAG: ThuA domain-containing protein, partial [Cyclobacteriaceae bacterium]|nr:ThuA domain-containing protein [Cyclobacteriaceae bacterium]
MKHILRLKKPFISLAVPFLFALLLSGCQSSRDQKRVLVFTRALKSVHASLPAGIDAITRLCLENGIAVDTTTNGGYFHEDSLPAYSAVIFLNTSADVLDYRQQADFERYIQSGGGFVGIHCAAATEYEWPWYNGLVGAWFDGHPDLQTATIHTTDVGHPSTDHLMKDWVRYDEWYNFRNIREGLQVVLTLDETTYEGGNHPGNHPIAWFHEYDGGRSFYTALGHTTESYTEEAFLTHVLGGIQYAIGDNRVSDYRQAKSQRVPADENFVKVVLDEKLDEPMELTVLPDGRILFVERRGDVHMYLPDERRTMLSIHLTVHDDYEEGLLGIAHDPAFADNQWIYLYYSPKGGASVQRLSRFTLSGNQVLADSEKVMLEIPAQREECCHSAGSIAFGPDGLLYLSLGDNTNPLTYTHYDRSYLFVPHDERPGRKNWDSQRTSGNTNDLRGGIIRIRPEADGTYTIPAGNLFPPGDSLSRPEIFVMGARNPFRISVDQHTGFVYFGEVGPDTGQDSERGPRGYDEFNQVRQAGNFGWPYHLGNNIPYYRYNHATGVLGEAFDPQNPENRSVNNTGRTLLPPAQPAMIWYPYEISEKFPSLGEGGRNAMAGPVYYAADYPPSSRKFPDYYSGKWFIYEWMRNWIKVVTFDEKNDFVKTEPFLPGLALSSPMDMEFGPDGALYLLEYGTNWFTGNDDARLVRIDYNDKNRLPIALATTQNSVGAVPLTVHFSADQSYDFDVADSLTFRWDLVSPTAKALGTGRQLDYTFEQPGEYRVELIVTDSKG